MPGCTMTMTACINWEDSAAGLAVCAEVRATPVATRSPRQTARTGNRLIIAVPPDETCTGDGRVSGGKPYGMPEVGRCQQQWCRLWCRLETRQCLQPPRNLPDS